MTVDVKIKLPENSLARLEALTKKCAYSSQAETIGNALRLLEKITSLAAEGHSFSITKDGKTKPLKIFE